MQRPGTSSSSEASTLRTTAGVHLTCMHVSECGRKPECWPSHDNEVLSIFKCFCVCVLQAGVCRAGLQAVCVHARSCSYRAAQSFIITLLSAWENQCRTSVHTPCSLRDCKGRNRDRWKMLEYKICLFRDFIPSSLHKYRIFPFVPAKGWVWPAHMEWHNWLTAEPGITVHRWEDTAWRRRISLRISRS